jgi:nitroreductase
MRTLRGPGAAPVDEVPIRQEASIMTDPLDLIRDRKSWRVPFDAGRAVPKEDLLRVLEAARWTPSAHNMQNWKIVVVDDPAVLARLAQVERPISEAFIKENYEQLSFSKEDLLTRKTGLLASMFPAEWQTPDFKLSAKPDSTAVAGDVEADALGTEGISSRQRALLPGPVMLVVVYDPTTRAPASEGDFLGIISLGCLMENLWLEAEALGLGVQIVSSLADSASFRDILGIPEGLRVAYSVRLGYPVKQPDDYLRVRLDVEDFTYFNRYGEG